jgi:hypothetical protein
MSAMRSFLSVPTLFAALALGSLGALSLGGCYDLSTTGPRPEDFVRDRNSNETQTQEQGQTEQRVDAHERNGAANMIAEDQSAAVIDALEAVELDSAPAPAPAANVVTAETSAARKRASD